jgi:glycosyltransferase involved in cell wall biosynthesis
MVSNLHLLRRLGCYSAVVYFSTEEHVPTQSDLDSLHQICDDVSHGGRRISRGDSSAISLAWDKVNYLVRGTLGWRDTRYPFSSTYDRIHAEKTILDEANRIRPDVVVIPLIFMHYARRLRAAGYKVILDASDVLSDLSRSFLKHFKGRGGKVGLLANHLACRTQERLSLSHCSEIWVTSGPEAVRFRQIAPHVPAVIVPNSLDEKTVRPGFHSSAPFVGFIGTYSYAPNLEAAEFLAGQVFPEMVRQFPAALLLLAGAGMPNEVKSRLERIANVRVLGPVSDSGQFMAECQILALPVRVRGGVPLKLIEGMARGKPIVATPETVSGLPLTPNQDLLVSDSAVDFAAAIVALLTYSSFRLHLGRNARATFVRHFSLSSAEKLLRCNSILSERGTAPTMLLRSVATKRVS